MMRAGERARIVGERQCSACHHEHKITSTGVMMVCGYCSCDEQGGSAGSAMEGQAGSSLPAGSIPVTDSDRRRSVHALFLPSDPFERLSDGCPAEPLPEPKPMPACEFKGATERDGWYFWSCSCTASRYRGFGRRTEAESREAWESHKARRVGV